MKRAPVVVIGLDAFDPQLATKWAASGELPELARLFAEGASSAIHNPFGLFVGALWCNFASALRPDRHGYHCWDEIDPGTYRWRRVSPDPSRYESFWKRLGDRGLRVAAVDVPHSRAPASLNGIEVCEWGCHDRHFGYHTQPPGLGAALAEVHGLHPVLGISPYEVRDFAPDDAAHRRGEFRTVDEELQLVRELVDGARAKGDMLVSLLDREPWDLFIGVFGESHAIGHQLYHLHDPSHPRFDPKVRARLGGDPLLRVYRQIDEAVGRLVERAGADATVLIHLSHGMTVHNDGTHLLDEVLTRLDNGAGRSGVAGQIRQALKPLQPALRRFAFACRLPANLRQALGQSLRGEQPSQRSRQRFYLAPNNFVYSGIRLNLVGREAQGTVQPDEFDSVCAALERDLLDLVNLATGKPAILSVTRSDAHHRRHGDDTIPDLFVEWERSAAIEAVSSARIGTVRTPYAGWRTGDHRPDGVLIARGPGFPAGATMAPLQVEDIGPSIAARLGVALEDVDGQVAPWLAGSSDPAMRTETASAS